MEGERLGTGLHDGSPYAPGPFGLGGPELFVGDRIRGAGQGCPDSFTREMRIGVQHVGLGCAFAELPRDQVTVIRGPRMTGLPSMTPGSTEMRDSAMGFGALAFVILGLLGIGRERARVGAGFGRGFDGFVCPRADSVLKGTRNDTSPA